MAETFCPECDGNTYLGRIGVDERTCPTCKGKGILEQEPIPPDNANAPDFRLIVLDETEYWTLPEFAGRFTAIEAVYLYDRNRVVHLCELTGSYELLHVETRAVTTEDCPEEVRDELSMALYAHEDGEPMYMHAHSVDALAKSFEGQEWKTHILDWDMDPEGDYETNLESVLEYVRGNSMV